jgi:magnesium-transporting ATPase (P-type)
MALIHLSTRATTGTHSSGEAAPVWQTLTPEQAVQELATSGDGLASGEARRRQQQYGANRLDAVAPPRLWRRVAAQFHNLLIYVLLAHIEAPTNPSYPW